MSSEPKIYTKPYKNCPECRSNKIVKNGYRNGVQRFKCKSCYYQFQSKRQTTRKARKIAQDYLFKNNLYQIYQIPMVEITNGSEIKLTV
jgi:transposase-like protein